MSSVSPSKDHHGWLAWSIRFLRDYISNIPSVLLVIRTRYVFYIEIINVQDARYRTRIDVHGCVLFYFGRNVHASRAPR